VLAIRIDSLPISSAPWTIGHSAIRIPGAKIWRKNLAQNLAQNLLKIWRQTLAGKYEKVYCLVRRKLIGASAFSQKR
jgi:hypothetical protein